MRQYDHTKIEKKWQKEWAKKKLYTTPDKAAGKKNYYLLTEFPYPSGNLHVGHWYAFAVPDILARHMRMTGKNVMYPIGFDAFGLPAENAAIKNKLNPRKWTEGNIAYMKKQLASMGASFDWSREVQTIDPNYYRWTQWLFLQFYKKGLAYKKETAVNWCPKDKTVLANEQVVNGKCERCSSEVEQRNMLQWNLKITDYADRLANDLDALNWPHQIKESQRNWIGKSEGAEIDFGLDVGKKYKFVILHGFTSGPDRPRFQHLKKELEAMGHEVILPALPNTNKPNEQEQVKTAFEATSYDENTVLCGFSLGSVVAMKVLEKLDRPIARLVTAGGFAMLDKKGKRFPFEKTFNWNFDFEKIRKNASSITILQDINDDHVTADQTADLEKSLQVNAVKVVANVPHFKGEKEPEVLMWLRPTIRVFTTRPDTLFGATYLVLSPEHPWVKLALGHKTVLKNNDEVQKYVIAAGKKTELERQENKEKTGVKLEGVEAINPATGEKIPLYVADYVLAHYGTGAIMAVPAHDERDFEFAKKFDLPIRHVVLPKRVDENNPHVEGKELVRRTIIAAIVRDPKTDTYLGLKWKKTGWTSFITGGIEKGEDPVETARREIAEETGFTDLKHIRTLGGPVHAEFFAKHKDVNRVAYATTILFELKSDAQKPVTQEEKDIHEPVWLDQKDLTRKNIDHAWMDIILERLQNEKDAPYTGEGMLYDSGVFSGLKNTDAMRHMTEQFGVAKKTYRIRDWVVSRQRYWGVPIPIIHCAKCGDVAVPDRDLPVKLPEVKDYLPTGDGKSPLAKVKKFVQAKCPQCKGKAERETDTFDTFVDSSWYFQRYTDPKNKKKFADPKKLAAWMPIDLYSGGAEHTTMHLLYSRFWHKAMYDLGLVKDSEPYTRRMNRSLIMGPDGQKMSKSKGNVIDPDEVVKKLGSDTVRMYLAFIGPYNEVASYPWNPDGVVGVRRFLERVWRLQEKLAAKPDADVERVVHQSIKKVGEDVALLKFNTAISQMMILVNAAEKGGMTKKQYEAFLKILAPFAPHMAEELWRSLGNKKSIHLEKWPKYDAKKIVQSTITMVVQINGKVRAQIEVAADAGEKDIQPLAEKAAGKWLEGQSFKKVIFVPGRLINFVV